MRRRPETGSAAIEAAVGLPAFMLFVALVILGGRLAIATQAVQASASEAARVASIARTQGAANGDATTAAAASLANQNVRCVRSTVTVDTTGFDAPVGTPAQVTATVRLRRGPRRPVPSRRPRHQDRDRHRQLTDRHLPGALTHDPPPPHDTTSGSAAR